MAEVAYPVVPNNAIDARREVHPEGRLTSGSSHRMLLEHPSASSVLALGRVDWSAGSLS